MVNPKNKYDTDDILLQFIKKKINEVSIKNIFKDSKIKYSCAGVIKMSKNCSKTF